VTSLEKTILLIDTVCNSSSIPYSIIGGIANIIHGAGRTTQDIDIIIQIELEELETVYDLFIQDFIPLKNDPKTFFRTYFVLPLKHKEHGTRVDISAALSEFEKNAIKRSERHTFGSAEAFFCSPEDLILFKLVARREQDLIDVRDIILRLKDTLDTEYLFSTAKLFEEIGRPDILDYLHSLLRNR